MAKYKYCAKNMAGKKEKGTLQVADESEAYEYLKCQGLYLMKITEERPRARIRPLNGTQLSEYAAQLATMLNAGLTLAAAMNILKQKESNIYLAQVYETIYSRLISGVSLSTAMEEQGNLFPTLMICRFLGGEESGKLGEAATELAKYYEKENRLKKSISTALMYPIFLLVIILIALIFLFTNILPSFFLLFESIEQIPSSTRFLIWFSNLLLEHGFAALLFIATLGLILYHVLQQPLGRRCFDKLLLKVPVLGKVLTAFYTARFSRTLSTLYSGGVPLVKAVQIATGAIENRQIKNQFHKVLEEICNGVPLSLALHSVSGLNKNLSTSIYIGEESGQLAVMLDRVADNFEQETDEVMKRLLTLLEPVMIVAIAVVIGFIMLSVINPIYQYYGSVNM